MQKYKAAIVDDSQEYREKVEAVLQSIAGKCEKSIECMNFSMAEVLVYELQAGAYFDIYVLDIEMPGMNGMETFERMKDYNTNVPVIFLTASGLEEDVVTAIKLGAANYLKKPFRPQELIKRVTQEFEKL